MPDISIVFVTAANVDEASKIGRVVVEEKLAACANIIPGIRSIYRWKAEIHDEEECLMVMKTRTALFPALRKRVCDLHSYEVPEVIAFPVAQGHADYLDWVIESTSEE